MFSAQPFDSASTFLLSALFGYTYPCFEKSEPGDLQPTGQGLRADLAAARRASFGWAQGRGGNATASRGGGDCVSAELERM